MSNGAIATEEFWGYLIKDDKSPSPVFEQLLLGIANYIVRSEYDNPHMRAQIADLAAVRQNRQIAPWDTTCLTPAKVAAFYRLVGGDYDALFLDTPHPSLSFIYQSLGCYHTLQPQPDPFTAPTVPALTPQGFVRWQTVQLLLEPEEHVPLLQTAVKRFDISNPVDGSAFPSWLPRDALPSKPDRDMLQWHETVSQKLMLEAQASQHRSIPPSHHRELSDGLSEGTLESSHSRDSSATDDRSLVDAATYFSESRPRPHFHPPEPLRMQQTMPPPRREPPPWSPERRRSNSDPNLQRSATWSTRDQLGRHKTLTRHAPASKARPRSPSTISTSSTSSSSSSSTNSSGGSLGPHHHHSASTTTLQPRRHSSHQLYDQRNGNVTPRQNPSPSVPPPQNLPSSFAHRHPSAPANANARGHNVRWGNDSVHHIPPGRDTGGKSRAKSEERPRRREEERKGNGDEGGVKGVGGRRYAAEETPWR